MSIADNIKQRREAKRWTQAELSEKSGIVSQAMISRIEKGEDNAKIDTLRGIAASHAAGDTALVAGRAAESLDFIGRHIATRDRRFADHVRLGL